MIETEGNPSVDELLRRFRDKDQKYKPINNAPVEFFFRFLREDMGMKLEQTTHD